MRGLLGLVVLVACGSGDPSAGAASATAAVLESASAAPEPTASSSVLVVAPRLIATAAEGAVSLRSDGESAYWVDYASHSIKRVPLAGGEATVVATGSAQSAIHLAGDDLYFGDFVENYARIFKVAKAGGKPAEIWKARWNGMASFVGAIAVHDGSVYFADSGAVLKIEPSGGTSVITSMYALPAFALGPDGLVVAQRASVRPDMKQGPGMVLRILPDGKPEPLPSFELRANPNAALGAGPTPIAVAVDAEGVYWIDAAGSPDMPMRLMALRKNTVEPVTVTAAVSSRPAGLLAHEGSLYWRTDEAIMRAPKAGGEEMVVVRRSSPPRDIGPFTIAGGQLLWVDHTRIMAKPL